MQDDTHLSNQNLHSIEGAVRVYLMKLMGNVLYYEHNGENCNNADVIDEVSSVLYVKKDNEGDKNGR